MTRWRVRILVRVCAVLLAGGAAPQAIARAPDGTLSLIRTPNNGVPSLVAPGGVFEARLSERATLRLVGPEPAPEMAVTWRDLAGGMVQARCEVAADARPGAYALEATTEGRADRNVRSVYVMDSFPEAYIVAHVSDTHVGSDRHPRSAEAIVRDLLETVNGSGAAFVLITGDLTENGEAEQFHQFVEVIDTCVPPTFVCPGNHDRQGRNYEDFFDAPTYSFWFGEDGYVGFDTKDFVIADELGRQDADLQVLRRAIKRARWSLGFTHRYDFGMGIRSQIVLFVDNPLDVLIFGHWHRSNREDETRVPWGNTRMVVTPAAVNGSLRLIEVTPSSVRPLEPMDVAEVR